MEEMALPTVPLVLSMTHKAAWGSGGGCGGLCSRRGYVIKKGERRGGRWADPGVNIDSVTYEWYRFGQVISHV